jgi:hypothetical protein
MTYLLLLLLKLPLWECCLRTVLGVAGAPPAWPPGPVAIENDRTRPTSSPLLCLAGETGPIFLNSSSALWTTVVGTR